MPNSDAKIGALATEVFPPPSITKGIARKKAAEPSTDSWTVVERYGGGGTYSSGSTTDWTFNFEDGTVAYVDYEIPTISGHLLLQQDSSAPVMATMRFQAPYTKSVTVRLVAAWGGGNAQVQINGRIINAYTADATITVDVRKGDNLIKVITDGTPENIELRGRLF